MEPGGRLPVVVAAAGEPWEAAALETIERSGAGLSLHKRCVDLQDLIATASTGRAQVAVAAAALPGVDADAVGAIRRSGLGVVLVFDGRAGDEDRLRRLGADELVDTDLDGLLTAVRSSAGTQPGADRPGPVDPGRAGRTVAVFGPAGAPGRTTVATGVAAELAHRGSSTFLLDADPYGGAVAQHLGVLDEVSGLLAAARLANAGRLDAARLSGLARSVGDGLRLLTGLPRPDRWSEVRAPGFDDLLTMAAGLDDRVVVDVGFSLERETGDPYDVSPQRNGMTLAALERADEVAVVGAADPVGLARLARALVDLDEVVPEAAVHVVVNRIRATLGWTEQEVRTMVAGFVRPVSLTFLPEDRASADRALMAGRSLVELGDGPLRRGISDLVTALQGEPAAASDGRWWRHFR